MYLLKILKALNGMKKENFEGKDSGKYKNMKRIMLQKQINNISIDNTALVPCCCTCTEK